MRTLKLWIQVSRPHQCMTAAFATLLTVVILQGQISRQAVWASVAIALSCLGASWFHFGAANRMYARKVRDRVDVRHPAILVSVGITAFAVSLVIGFTQLGFLGQAFLLYNALAVVAYARWLSKHWTTKNLTIAVVCVTPLLLGWAVSRNTDSSFLWLVAMVFFAYWAREIVKDIADIRANQGFRVTLPIWIGIDRARWIGAGFLCVSVICLWLAGRSLAGDSSTALALVWLAAMLFASVAVTMTFGRTHISAEKRIMFANWLLMFSILGRTIGLTK